MNAARRKAISEAIALIDQAHDLVENVANGERESFDNLPEGLQESERGERMDEIASALEEAYMTLTDVVDQLTDACE